MTTAAISAAGFVAGGNVEKYDFVKYKGCKKPDRFTPDVGSLGIITGKANDEYSVEWKNGRLKKSAWFKPDELELVKSFKWPDEEASN